MQANQETDTPFGTFEKFQEMRIRYTNSSVAYFQSHSLPIRFSIIFALLTITAITTVRVWLILVCFAVICSLITMLYFMAIQTRHAYRKLMYGFFIIFILSCVWNYLSLYEEETAKINARLDQWNWVAPRDCYYYKMWFYEKMGYYFRVNIFKYDDQCPLYHRDSRADPLYRVNPLEAISLSLAMFFFKPLDYIGGKMGSFYTSFIENGSPLMKPILLGFAILLTILAFYGQFRISSPILTFEPAWRPQQPPIANQQNNVIEREILTGHEEEPASSQRGPERTETDASVNGSKTDERGASGTEKLNELDGDTNVMAEE